MALISSLSSGVSAMQAFTTGINVIGNNIANVNTYGFKDARVDYADSFSNVFTHASGNNNSAPSTKQVGTGSMVASTTSNFGQGDITSTGITTDLAINGEGYFQVVDPNNDSVYATRAGNFTTDDNGYLLTPDGMRVQGLVGGRVTYTVTQNAAGELVYTPNAPTAPSAVGDMNMSFGLSVANGGLIVDSGVTASTAEINSRAPGLASKAFDSNGGLTLYLSDGNSFTQSQVLLMNFRNPNALVKTGDNLYSNLTAAGPASGQVTMTAANNMPDTNGLGSFKTESLELSNVDLTKEFANLIVAQRSFQSASRVITVSDEVLQEVVNLKR